MQLRKTPKDYQTLFLDMNSYFASVEQQVRPLLRGRPVGVTPYPGDTGCVIACSYEAKAQGVRTGDMVRDAKGKCPKIEIVEARPALYQIYHREIIKAIESCTSGIIALSIDEFAVKLSGNEVGYSASKNLALKIKKAIYDVGDWLKCSVGVGPNRFLSKVAAGSKKPDGLTILKLCELENFYKSIKLRDIPGINYQMEKCLARHGIYSAHDFYKLDQVAISKMLKHPGKVWYLRLHGFEVDDFEIVTKNCGHSHVLAPQLRNRESAMAVMEKLAHKTAYRLRRGGFTAGGVFVSIHFLRGGFYHQAKRVAPFSDTATLKEHIKNLLAGCDWREPILVAVSTFNLTRIKSGIQISIFPEIEKSRQISKALDEVNDTFGADTLYFASMQKGLHSAPDRIPFGRVRYDIKHF
jgi:DNA polymerase-4